MPRDGVLGPNCEQERPFQPVPNEHTARAVQPHTVRSVATVQVSPSQRRSGASSSRMPHDHAGALLMPPVCALRGVNPVVDRGLVPHLAQVGEIPL